VLVATDAQVFFVRGEQAAGFTQCVAMVAGPAVVFGLVDHARAHEVEFDVAVAGEYVVLALRRKPWSVLVCFVCLR